MREHFGLTCQKSVIKKTPLCGDNITIKNSKIINHKVIEMIDFSTLNFDMSDKSRVEKLSDFLVNTQRGWIDVDIYNKVDDYKQNNPCYYWITITIPEGVAWENSYLSKTRSNHIDFLNQLRRSIKLEQQGELLFYVIDLSGILCLAKINLPCDINIQTIQQQLQKFEDELYKSLSGQVNINWKVSCSKVYEYNDIPVTLKLYEKLMESPL